MAKVTYEELLEAGVHFGHLTRKWHPAMAQYIFMERNGIHIIDLNKTVQSIEHAITAFKQIVKSGRKILFVATKKQAKDIVSVEAKKINMPYVTERWLGGMLTNFATIRKSIKKMTSFDKMLTDGTYETLSKKEKLTIQRDKTKLEKVLGGIAQLTRLPAALFVIDIKKEHIAISEAVKLNIPIFAMVDTNSNPEKVDFVIPSNDDATKSIALITKTLTDAIQEGITERINEKLIEEKDTETELAEKENLPIENKLEVDDEKILEFAESNPGKKNIKAKKEEFSTYSDSQKTTPKKSKQRKRKISY